MEKRPKKNKQPRTRTKTKHETTDNKAPKNKDNKNNKYGGLG